MMNKDLVIGIDGGTGGMRAFVFDRIGNVAGKGECAYDTHYPSPGWAEQTPNDWLRAAEISVHKAMENIAPERIAAICAATTSCTVVCCAQDGHALSPAVLWMDVRASQQVREIQEKTGQSLLAELFICKALWIKKHRPSLWRQTTVLCEYQDFFNYWLTGNWCFSVNTACNWGYNSRKSEFNKEFYESIGLEDALRKIPTCAVRVGMPVGVLQEEAAVKMGLPAGIPVVQGGIDSSIGMLGMGVTRPGEVALMTGSSNLAMAVTRYPMFISEDAINSGPDFLIDGYYTSVQGQAASGAVLKWFRRELCADLGEDAFRKLDADATKVEPGCGGVRILDYWQGNRVPYNDPEAKGVITGLSMGTTRAQMFRAVMEGVACGTQDLIQAFAENGNLVKSVNVSGGTTRSNVFLQIHADVSGIPFHVTSDYSVALGAGVAAAYAAGWYATPTDAAEAMVCYEKVVMPNMQNYAVYKNVREQYKKIYIGLKNEKIF